MIPPSARLFGHDRVEITDLDSWLAHAPPEKGEAQWKDGHSAKEQAKAWLRSGTPAVPEELWSSIAHLVPVGVDEVYRRPEHKTRLDRFPRARQHDLFACLRRQGDTVLVVGVEAKACEDFDGLVADRAASGPPSNKRARCNLLARALFGRDVFDEATGEILDERLAAHGYQLWTAAVGTIIEAQQRGVGQAVVVVHQFLPRDVVAAAETGDTRDWKSALAANEQRSMRSSARLTRRVRDRTRPTSSRLARHCTRSRSKPRSTPKAERSRGRRPDLRSGSRHACSSSREAAAPRSSVSRPASL